MINWYDDLAVWANMEDNNEFMQKVNLDEEDFKKIHHRKTCTSVKQRDSAWVRNDRHKKRMRHCFLSINPAMNIDELGGMKCSEAIYLHWPTFEDGKFHDARMEYCLNPYEKIFLSKRGDLRVYHGNVFYHRSGSFTLVNKDPFVSKLTNKRIRNDAISEEESPKHYSFYKKCYGPRVDDLW